MKYLTQKQLIEFIEKEYNLWLKGGCFGKEYKNGTEWIDFIEYLKNKYVKKRKTT